MKSTTRLFLSLIALAASVLLLATPAAARPPAQDPYPFGTPTPNLTPSATVNMDPYAYPGYQSPTTGASTQENAATSTLLTPFPDQASQTPSPTTSESPAFSRNLFGTEDAEMYAARVTPPSSETPAPSQPAPPTQTLSASPTPGGLFMMNRMWFTAGILIPPCILVLFWLAHRARRSGEFR